jgi:hypothetical protein
VNTELANALAVVLTAMAGLVVAAIRLYAAKLSAIADDRMEDAKADRLCTYLRVVETTATDVVMAMNQAVVDDLKANGSFDDEAKERVLNEAKNKVKDILTAKADEFAEMLWVDLDTLVEVAIHAALKRIKS